VVTVIDTTPPDVSILYPFVGQKFWAGDSIKLDYVVTNIADPHPVVTVTPSYPIDAPLPVGDLTISVTATDASDNIGTATLMVSIVPIPVAIDFDPDTLNLTRNGKWVTVFIEMPEGYDVRNIDGSSVMLNGIVPAYLGNEGWPQADANDGNITDYDGDSIPERTVKFDMELVKQLFTEGDEVEITISGLVDRIDFEGTVIVRVINEVGNGKAKGK